MPRIGGGAIAAQKKSRRASEQNKRKRAWHWRRLKKIAHSRLKFVDEAGVNTTYTRDYARATGGARAVEFVPRNYSQPTSIISTVSIHGVEATMTIAGSVDAAVFDVYCQTVLRPTLQPGDVVVLDNLGAHRASRIEQVARECGAQVVWLPPYSPDFSPIEPMWSKLKAFVKTAKARAQNELDEAISAGLRTITASDCCGWFKHCGYEVAHN